MQYKTFGPRDLDFGSALGFENWGYEGFGQFSVSDLSFGDSTPLSDIVKLAVTFNIMMPSLPSLYYAKLGKQNRPLHYNNRWRRPKPKLQSSNPRNSKLQSKSKTQSPKDLVLQHAYFLRLSEAVDNRFCSIALEKIEKKFRTKERHLLLFLNPQLLPNFTKLAEMISERLAEYPGENHKRKTLNFGR